MFEVAKLSGNTTDYQELIKMIESLPIGHGKAISIMALLEVVVRDAYDSGHENGRAYEDSGTY